MAKLLKKYPAEEISGFAEFHSQATERNEFLNRLKAGTESLATWKYWGIQRYKAAIGFIPFLKAGLKKAETFNLIHTAGALYENLCDEMGVHPITQENLIIGPHEKWRVDFYNAMGITAEDLQKEKALDSTDSYIKTLEHVAVHSNACEHVGALVTMEYAIAKEMEMIEAGLDNTSDLKDIFTQSTKQGRKNRLYITHHAAHDLKQHFPELVNAVTLDLNEKPGGLGWLESICDGSQKISEARQNFYDGLQISTLG
jgi:hypothetical protein